jgi:amidase
VAAGFSPISIGGEVDGSLTQPACRAALYALKPTVGKVPSTGTFGFTTFLDSHGAMAKTVRDLADITSILMGDEGLSDKMKKSWKGLRIGMVDPVIWEPAAFVVEPVQEFTEQIVCCPYEGRETLLTLA